MGSCPPSFTRTTWALAPRAVLCCISLPMSSSPRIACHSRFSSRPGAQWCQQMPRTCSEHVYAAYRTCRRCIQSILGRAPVLHWLFRDSSVRFLYSCSNCSVLFDVFLMPSPQPHNSHVTISHSFVAIFSQQLLGGTLGLYLYTRLLGQQSLSMGPACCTGHSQVCRRTAASGHIIMSNACMQVLSSAHSFHLVCCRLK